MAGAGGRRGLAALAVVPLWLALAGEVAPAAPAQPAHPDFLALIEEALEYQHDSVRTAALNQFEWLRERALPCLDALMQKLRAAPTAKEGRIFAQALLRIGDGIAPAVKKLMEAKETKPLLVLVSLWDVKYSKTPEVLRLLVQYPEPDVSLPAFQCLSRSDAAKGVVPGYIKAGLGQDSKTRLATLGALAGREALAECRDYILAAVQDPYAEVRALAAGRLSWLDKPSPQLADMLGKLLMEDDDEQVRQIAASDLGRMGELGLPWLTKALQHPDRNVRWAALGTLEYLGPQAKSALPAIREAAQKERPLQARPYERAEAKILGAPPPTLEQRLEALKLKPNPRDGDACIQARITRQVALDALREAAPADAEKVAPALSQIVLNTKFEIKPGVLRPSIDFEMGCVSALPHFGPLAIPVLLELFERPEETARKLAESAALGTPDPFRRAMLVAFLQSSNVKAQLVAVRSLTMWGRSQEVLVSVAEEVLKSPNREVRLQGLKALARRDPSELPRLAPLILPLLADQDAEIQSAALQVFRIGRMSVPADWDATACLKSPNQELRRTVALALAKEGRCPDAAIPVFEDILRDGKLTANAKRPALRGLAAAGPKAAGLRPVVLPIAKDPKADGETAEAALAALAALETSLAAKQELLLGYFSAQNSGLQSAAARLLGQLGRAVLPKLVALAVDPHAAPTLPWSLSEAFKAAGPDALDSLVSLMADARGRRVAQSALPHFGAQGAARVAPLLKSQDAACASAALLILSRIGTAAESTAPMVRAVYETGPASLRADALAIWADVGPKDPALPACVLKALGSPTWAIRRSAAHTAANLGLPADKVIPVLAREFSQTQDQRTRYEALYAIAAFGDAGVPHMVSAAESTDPNIQEIAWHGLGHAQLAGLPALGKLIQSAQPEVRTHAAEMLRNRGPLAAIPLRAALRNKDPAIQEQAKAELKKLGLLGAPALGGK